MSAPHLRVTCTPLGRAENSICAVVDRLLLLDVLFTSSPNGLSAEQCRAADRLLGEALDEAREIEAAWIATSGGDA